MEEFEVKFLDISPKEIEEKLNKLGAKKMFGRLYKRKVFDFPDFSLNKQAAFLRLRDEGDKITLAFKQRLGVGKRSGNDLGMEEIEVVVSNFDTTEKILLNIGLVEKFYEENRRVRFILNEIEFDIDYWPLINPYLEIESSSRNKVNEGIKLLGLDADDSKTYPTMQVYKHYGIDEMSFKILTFEKQVKRDLY